jgi:glycosyltransferase involved in cell wall biosynthesis|uniref:Glycosyltransferase family 1 protein n=1 Tax=Desulfobacca acetoxidans TaxID=60893 RepID=A0A7V6DPW1_9BACT
MTTGKPKTENRKWHYTILHTESSLGWGGQEHRVLAEARVMPRRGHRLLIACDPRGELYRRAGREDVAVVPLQFGGRANVSAWLALRRLLLQERVDILNTHSSLDSWVAFLAWLRIGNKIKLVRTRHLSTQVRPNWPTRQLYQAPAAIITTGRGISELLHQRLGVPRQRLHSIPTGVDLGDFFPQLPDPKLAKRLHLPPGTFVFGTISVLRSWKGHLYLLEAFKELREEGLNAILLIVGEGPYRPVIEEKIKELRLTEAVRLPGHQDAVPEWLALMDAFVLASYAHEGIPQALLQALAMGKPVVSTRVGGIPEVIVPEETGLLAPPRDFQTLARAMGRLAQNESLREALGRRGPHLVASRYSLEQMADALERLYTDIMATHSDPVSPAPASQKKGAS